VKGQGVIVSGFYVQTYSGGKTQFSRTVGAWLVLDGTIYPLNNIAARNTGKVESGLPDDVQRLSGITNRFQRGGTKLDEVGLEEYKSLSRGSAGFAPCPRQG